ncbi:MAG: AlpA family phage regulatory protein [Oxalobacter sp.]|nr:MAG: AlpA family phage regulatory protein [Oxalobacter sp.]
MKGIKMNTEPCKMLLKNDVAARLGVTERYLEKLVKDGQFPPSFRLGKRAVWAEQAVDNWLSELMAAQLNWRMPRRKRVQ